MPRIDLKAYARRGAEARIAELNAELADIYQAFPELRGGRAQKVVVNHEEQYSALRPDAGAQTPPARQRRTMSAAQRKAVGERMKKYWAQRKAAAQKKR